MAFQAGERLKVQDPNRSFFFQKFSPNCSYRCLPLQLSFVDELTCLPHFQTLPWLALYWLPKHTRWRSDKGVSAISLGIWISLLIRFVYNAACAIYLKWCPQSSLTNRDRPTFQFWSPKGRTSEIANFLKTSISTKFSERLTTVRHVTTDADPYENFPLAPQFGLADSDFQKLSMSEISHHLREWRIISESFDFQELRFLLGAPNDKNIAVQSAWTRWDFPRGTCNSQNLCFRGPECQHQWVPRIILDLIFMKLHCYIRYA